MQINNTPIARSVVAPRVTSNRQEMNFGAAKDINLRYIMEKRSHLLPPRMWSAVSEVLKKNEGVPTEKLPTLKEVHTEVYAPLMQCKTLDELKATGLYPEFLCVRDFTAIAREFSRSARKISAQMPLEDFSLDCLKKIWSGMPQEDIVKAYGFSCRKMLTKICDNLGISKPAGNYLTLLKTSDEAGNRAIAEKTLQHLDVCRANLAKAGLLCNTPEARAKQVAGMKKFYEDNPYRREEASMISKEVWRRCQDIKDAQAEFLAQQPVYVQVAARKIMHNEPTTEKEKRAGGAFFKTFWDKFEDCREKYGRIRKEVVQEMKEKK